MGWFEVDKKGLAQLVRRRGLAFVLYELVQNAWDTSIPNRPAVNFSVYDDDPDGFRDLSHAYTLYASSEKKADSRKRGRFNLGEKLVLAACESATISTTTGTILFEQRSGKFTRTVKQTKREVGSLFEAVIRMTRAEQAEVIEAAQLLLPPIQTTINGVEIPFREPFKRFEAALATEISDDEGNLKRTTRKTEVELYKLGEGRPAFLYEMGIPVVELDLPWSVNIQQKVPLNADRDNVTNAYRKALSVAVLNEMHNQLKTEDASNVLLQEALEHPDVSDAAVKAVLTHRFGEARTIYDPSDPEANSKAFAHGHTVIPGGTFSKPAWANIRRTGAAQPSGQLFPTPKPYDPEGDPVRIIPEHQWTNGMQAVADYARGLALRLMDVNIAVTMENEPTQGYSANYGPGHLTFNVPKLGKRWFDLQKNFEGVTDLIIHEFGHHYAMNHLDEKYHKALTRLGAKLAHTALTNPEFFKQFEA
jgi:hypothetical protein